MTANRKTLLVSKSMARAGWRLLEARADVEAIPFPHTAPPEEFRALLRERPKVDGMILGLTRVSDPELELARGLQVVARIGVGYDTIDVPALTRRRVPLMITGTANSPSVAEAALFLMLTLAKRGAALDALVKEGRWAERLANMPADLYGKAVLIVGFGRIGTRTLKRCIAMEMQAMVHDPYVPVAAIRAAGAEPVADLDAALPRADFVTIHCPKTAETNRMFDAARLARMKPSAFLINTARGGIVDEAALHAALTSGRLAGAGIDVLEEEPPPRDHPLLKLPSVITAPHMAGVTAEAFDRMAMQAVENVLGALDGRINRDNVVNQDVLG